MSRTTPSYDPLTRFPYEIWSKCILFAIYRVPEGPLPLLGVSTHWQDQLLDSPEMWSYIHVEDGEDVCARVHTFLHLSGRHSLEVCISPGDPVWPVIRQVLLLHKERITNLYLVHWPLMLEKSQIVELFRGMVFPVVRIIDAGGTRLAASWLAPLIVLCPNLQYCPGIEFLEDNATIAEGLRSMEGYLRLPTASSSLSQKAKSLIHLPSLESLHISIRVSNMWIGSPSNRLRSDASEFVLSSKSLVRLWIYTDIRLVIEGILSSSLIHLQSLSIYTLCSNVDVVIRSLPFLPSLQILDLVLDDDGTGIQECPTLNHSDIPRLRLFKLAIRGASYHHFTKLFDALTSHDALVSVESFELSCDDQVPPEPAHAYRMMYSVRNARRVVFLYPWFDKPESDRINIVDIPIHMPNLLWLEISFSILLTQIDAPSLNSLHLPLTNPPKSMNLPNYFPSAITRLEIGGEAFNSLIPRSDHWNSLQNIRWTTYDSLVVSKTATLKSIRLVEFTTTGLFGDYDPTHALNSFLVTLLRYPDACPHLHTVKSWGYPLWELLIQLLLQRNKNDNLVQLQELWLPGLPVRPLLSLVVKLLNSSSNEMVPRNLDYILLRRFQHEMIVACRYCIGAGYIDCSHNLYSSSLWSQEMQGGSTHDGRSDQDYQGLLELNIKSSSLSTPSEAGKGTIPTTTWKEWQDRLDEMKKGWTSLELRTVCGRHNLAELVRIHRYSLGVHG